MSVLNTQPAAVSEATPEATPRFAPTYRCRHLHTDGRQCGSPSLRQEHFCYYHHTTRVPAPKPPAHRSISDMEFDLPIPEDRIAVNHAQQLYQNPLVNMAYTLLEPLPVGVVITLVSSALLRRTEPLPSPATAASVA